METLKRPSTIIYICFVLLLPLSGWLAYRSWQKDNIIAAKNVELAKWSKEMHKYKDKSGKEHTQTAQKNLSVKESVTVLGDKVAETIGIKDKQIQDVTDVNTQIKGEIKAKAEVVSTVKAENQKLRDSLYRIKYADKYLILNGELNADTKDFTAGYSYTDSMRIVRFTQKSFFRKKTFVDVASDNPNRAITGLRSIKIGDDRIKRLNIGPAVGYMYNSSTGKFEIIGGIALSYALIRF